MFYLQQLPARSCGTVFYDEPELRAWVGPTVLKQGRKQLVRDIKLLTLVLNAGPRANKMYRGGCTYSRIFVDGWDGDSFDSEDGSHAYLLRNSFPEI